MRRLIDNIDYDVLTRDNLEQIFVETGRDWEGKFNTETGAKLGELLSASLFIVGRIIYCGPLVSDTSSGGHSILAALQLVDIETGKVLLSSANEGKFLPKEIPAYLLDDDQERRGGSRGIASSSQEEDSEHPEAGTLLADQPQSHDAGPQDGSPDPKQQSQRSMNNNTEGAEPPNSLNDYPLLKAAESLADGFANKFFSRPRWETVTMWTSSEWSYGASIRYVQLGNCPSAVTLLHNAAQELTSMSPSDVARYLHNYGVALLCSDKMDLAMRKLRSSYRLERSQATLDMLSLAARISEWSLDVEVDTGPEVNYLLQRHTFLPEEWALEPPLDASP